MAACFGRGNNLLTRFLSNIYDILEPYSFNRKRVYTILVVKHHFQSYLGYCEGQSCLLFEDACYNYIPAPKKLMKSFHIKLHDFVVMVIRL